MRFVLSAITLVIANVAFAADSAVEVKTMPLSNFDEFMIFKYEGHPASINHSYMIDLAEPASLQVVDFEDAGEQYFIYDNGGLLGVTSNVHLDSNAFAESPQKAAEDRQFSTGIFKLSKGTHEITFQVETPYVSGSAAVRLLKKVHRLWKHDGKGIGRDDDDDGYYDDIYDGHEDGGDKDHN
ncbi:unnamed protein product [Umbelopsis vinacea]